MRAGELRHWVALYDPTYTRSTTGEQEVSYPTEHSTRPAFVEPLSGREGLDTQALVATATHQVRMRWFDGLKTTWRIKFGERWLEIVSLKNVDERNVEWVLTCAEAQ